MPQDFDRRASKKRAGPGGTGPGVVVAWACRPGVADADGDGGGLVVALPLQAAVEEAGQVVAVGEDIGLALDLAEHAVELVLVEEVGPAGHHQGGVVLAVPLVPDPAFEGQLDLVELFDRFVEECAQSVLDNWTA